MNKPYTVRQGDVMLMRVDVLPKDAEKQEDDGRIVLAYGEVTGHAHAISTKFATRYQWKGDVLIDVGEQGAELVHEEHSTIVLQPGVYKKIQQVQYTPERIINVTD